MIEEKVCFLDAEGVLQSYQSIYILNDKRFGSNCKIACCKVIHKGEVYSKEEFEDLGLVASIESCEEQPLDETVTTLVDNGDNSFTYTNESGTPVTFTVEDEDTTYQLQDNDDGTFDLVDSNGDVISTIDICKLIKDGGCIEPVAEDDEEETPFETPISDTVSVNDTLVHGDTGPLTYTLGAGPTNGTLVFNTDGTYTYTPDDGFFGKDEFTYTVTNSESETDTATVCITILEPDAPTIVIKHITGGTSLPVAVNIDSTTECDTTPSNNIIGFTYYLNGFPVITVPPFINDGTNRPAFTGLDISSIGGTLNYDTNLLGFLNANGIVYNYLDQIKIVATIEDSCGLTNSSNDLIYTITDRPNAVANISQTDETGNSVDNIDMSFVFTKASGANATSTDCFRIRKILKGVNGGTDVLEEFTGNVGDLIPTTCLENVGLTGGTQTWTGNVLSLVGYSKNIPTLDANGNLTPDLSLSGEIEINIQINENCSGLINEEDFEANIKVLRGCWGDTFGLGQTDTVALSPCPRNGVAENRRTGLGAQPQADRFSMNYDVNGVGPTLAIPCPNFPALWVPSPEGTGVRYYEFESIVPKPFYYAQLGNVSLCQNILVEDYATNQSSPAHLRLTISDLTRDTVTIKTTNRAQFPNSVISGIEIYINGQSVETRPDLVGGPTSESPYPNTSVYDIAAISRNTKEETYTIEMRGMVTYLGETYELKTQGAYMLSYR